MAWIESHQALGRHPKLLRLAAQLRIHKAQAVGHLKYLWWWALDYAPKGNLSAFASAEISAAAEWHGDPEVFVETLKETGWLEANGEIHDWSHYAGPWLRTLARQKRYRQTTLKRRNGDVIVTSNLTQPNLTKPTKPNQRGAQSPDALQTDRGIIEKWLSYLAERGKSITGPIALDALYKKLLELGPGRAAAIEYSMANGWLSIHQDKDAKKDEVPAYWTPLEKA